MPKKYPVNLSDGELKELKSISRKKNTSKTLELVHIREKWYNKRYEIYK